MSSPFTHLVILDFEATCLRGNPPRPQEVIEFPSVLLELDGLEVVDEFESFVRPRFHPVLSEFCTELTSIRQSDVDGAELFPDVLQRHRAWLERHGLTEENALIVTCGDWDLKKLLPVQCAATTPPIRDLPPIYTRWHNLKKSYQAVRSRSRAPGMRGMLKGMGLELIGRHHRGIDDCRNIARLCRALVQSGAEIGVTGQLGSVE